MRGIREQARKVVARLRDHTGERGDRGVTSIEYAGIVIVVAGIVIAVRALGLDATISSAIATWVNGVVGGG